MGIMCMLSILFIVFGIYGILRGLKYDREDDRSTDTL